MGSRVLSPAAQLFAGSDRTRRIVRETEVNQIDRISRRLRNEVRRCCAWQISYPLVTAVLSDRAGVASHHVRIDVDGINRVSNCDPVLIAKDIQNVTAIA